VIFSHLFRCCSEGKAQQKQSLEAVPEGLELAMDIVGSDYELSYPKFDNVIQYDSVLKLSSISLSFETMAAQPCECSDVKNWNAEPQAKARLQCGIAVLNKDDPNKTLRWIFERELELIPISDPAFDPVERLLCDLAELVGVAS
jgi:hypothetical protein